MRIGVFDSGIGGEIIATELRNKFTTDEVISANDHAHVPYGNRTKNEIIKLTDTAIQPLINSNCKVIVIACNTATTVAIGDLRNKYPEIIFIGIEPMIKPAAKITKTGSIAVCATPMTLRSDRYKQLKCDWAQGVNVVEPDCSNWAELIENNESNKIKIDDLMQYLKSKNTDVVVLGCTHYHWIKERIEKCAGPNIKILEPTDTIADRVQKLIK
ncbi:glutamate racemase [Candidatus Saccharibacteria bacterium]|nr:glutamate racemase [Candidatus Saccharibacteria bacterium]